MEKRSPLWYYLPLFLGIVGGVIAYLKLKKNDGIKARNCLILGIILTIPFVIALGLTAYSGMENPFYVISSGAMAPELQVFDVIIVERNTPFENIQKGDLVVFHRPAGHDRVIISRTVEILDENPYVIRTKGDANPSSIPGTDFPITMQEYIGKVAYVIPQIGYITRILVPPISYIIILLILAIPLIQHGMYRREIKNELP